MGSKNSNGLIHIKKVGKEYKKHHNRTGMRYDDEYYMPNDRNSYRNYNDRHSQVYAPYNQGRRNQYQHHGNHNNSIERSYADYLYSGNIYSRNRRANNIQKKSSGSGIKPNPKKMPGVYKLYQPKENKLSSMEKPLNRNELKQKKLEFENMLKSNPDWFSSDESSSTEENSSNKPNTDKTEEIDAIVSDTIHKKEPVKEPIIQNKKQRIKKPKKRKHWTLKKGNVATTNNIINVPQPAEDVCQSISTPKFKRSGNGKYRRKNQTHATKETHPQRRNGNKKWVKKDNLC
eukprot:TRINITY_DN1351_c0_g1_i2.p1 TRINITY_DN1351_c0_g1~~TRINITY_DN1351_c0_g1_i2.p1  ORF type:complete len:288 (-),score=40.12 TRINITY_DN1351_c0_g1_i2:36-899(-)